MAEVMVAMTMFSSNTALSCFDLAPDLLLDARVVDDFMANGMASFEAMAANFNLSDDPEGALQMGIALQAYVRKEFDLSVRTLKEFATVESRLVSLGRVFEVLYKAVMRNAGKASTYWVAFAVELYMAHSHSAEVQRLALEFFVYFGLWNHALNVHAQLPRKPFEPWRRQIMLGRARAEGFQPRRRFSIVLLTWNRADLLDRCLNEIRSKARDKDYEIIVGVNASTDHTAQVLEKHPIDRVFWNSTNESIDYYRKLFDAAEGETIIEIDDNVVELPEAFDLLLESHLHTFPEYGFIGFQPTGLNLQTGERALMIGAPESSYKAVERDGLSLHVGPVWGCCAAIAKRTFLNIGGFYGLRMSKTLGEESQIVRKLWMHGQDGALLRGQTLLKGY